MTLEEFEQGFEAMGKWLRETTFTPKQVEQNLTDESCFARALFAAHANSLSAAQIERGLIDEDRFVRKVFIERADFMPTELQMERGLKDPDAQIRLLFQEKQARWESKTLQQRYANVITAESNREAL